MVCFFVFILGTTSSARSLAIPLAYEGCIACGILLLFPASRIRSLPADFAHERKRIWLRTHCILIRTFNIEGKQHLFLSCC